MFYILLVASTHNDDIQHNSTPSHVVWLLNNSSPKHYIGLVDSNQI